MKWPTPYVENKSRTAKFLILRRLCQLSIIILFFLGPLSGIWLIKGNLAGSMVLGVLPLTDPLTLLQTLLAGHQITMTAISGMAIIIVFYFLIGGRAFCSWVCPVNIINDGGHLLRQHSKLGDGNLGSSGRYWLLALALLLPLITGQANWEDINPVNIISRGLIFHQGSTLWLAAGLLLFAIILKGGWCRICPTGAFYSCLGHFSPLKIRIQNLKNCDNCNACFKICPEPQVLTAPLKKADHIPIVKSGQCTNCGRCIDICHKNIFKFGSRY